jgi:hypothetical protein
MKKLVLIAILSGFSLNFMGQTFTNSPNDSIVLNLPGNHYSELPIYQINQTSDTLRMSVEVVYNDVPAGWDGMICVFGSCLGSILPVGGTGTQMDVWGSNQGMVRLTVNPFNDTTTAAMLRIYCYDNTLPFSGDTLTWILNSSPTSISEYELAAEKVTVYPNPAKDVVNINQLPAETALIEVYDVSGKLVKQLKPMATTAAIDVNNLEPGIYQINIIGNDNTMVSKKLMVQ